jgi:hypothetical protein
VIIEMDSNIEYNGHGKEWKELNEFASTLVVGWNASDAAICSHTHIHQRATKCCATELTVEHGMTRNNDHDSDNDNDNDNDNDTDDDITGQGQCLSCV